MVESTRVAPLAGASENGTPLAPVTPARSVEIASRGICTTGDAANFLSSLIGDVMTDKVPVRIANTGINALGKLLKVADMQQKYGRAEGQAIPTQLQLAGPAEAGTSDPLLQEENRLLEQLAALRKERAAR